VTTIVKVAHVRLCHSRMPFVRAYPRESQEMGNPPVEATLRERRSSRGSPLRDCAVTELVDSAPEEIGIAADLLGHADLGTTRRHYIQANGMVAHTRVQRLIARRRAAASGKAHAD
jgi:integrase